MRWTGYLPRRAAARRLLRVLDVLSADEQLEVWWESLSADQRAAVLRVDFDDDIPGWMIASLVAAHVALDEDPATPAATDFKFRVPQALQEFVDGKRSAS